MSQVEGGPKERRPRSPWTGIIGTAIAAIAVGLTAASSGLFSGEQQEVEAAFTRPPGGTFVSRPTDRPIGTVTGLTKGQHLWLSERPSDARLEHPQETPCDVDDGTWACNPLYLGTPGDHGKQFTLTLVVADEQGHKALLRYAERDPRDPERYEGIPFPEGVTVVETISVRLK